MTNEEVLNLLAVKAFDPFPFILLNLVLSCVAAIQAPLIMMSQNRQEEKQVKLQNASNITKEIAEAGYRLYKDNYRLPADDKELKSSRPEFFQKPLRSIGIRGTDLVTDYFWEQLDMFMDPQAREKQMKMDETVDIIRKRFGFYSVQGGLMYRDKILSACDTKSDHTVHPHGYFG